MLYDAAYSLYVAMLVGTLVGLVVKFLLDKHYIFKAKTEHLHEDVQHFTLYSLTGVFTTAIFWLFELSFDYWFEHDNAKYLGALIGLSIGYLIKYQLDKQFVFRVKQ